MKENSVVVIVRRCLLVAVATFAVAGAFGQDSSQQNSSATPQSKASEPSAAAPTTTATPSKPAVSSDGKTSGAGPAILQLNHEPRLDPSGKPLYETIQEDWSSLQVGASKLEPRPPLLGNVTETNKFIRYMVQVQWRPGDPIDLYVVIPKGVKKPPVVLYLYNYLEDPERFHNDGWCERVTSNGVAAVGFLSALSSDRFRDRPMKQWFVSELQESLGSTVHDIKFILDYLESRGDVDVTRAGMWGEGSGGAIAILAAAADPRIRAVDVLEPWGDWADFLTQSPVVSADPDRDEYGKPEFQKKVAPLDPVKWLPTLKTPIRVQQIKQNLVIPMECKESIKGALPKQAELLRFEGLRELANREKGGALFDWIKEKVQDSGQPQTGADQKKSVAERNSLDPKEPAAHP